MMKFFLPLAALVLSLPAGNARAGDEVELVSHDMGHGIWMIAGQGGNIGVSIGEDGIFLIDDQYAPLTPKIRAEIARLAGDDRQVDFLLNTHVHGDHTGGNENFGKAGTLIVAHENVRSRMDTDEFRKAFLERGGKDIDAALPVVTFNDRIAFHLNGETLRIHHFPTAHTDGDSVIFFEGANVVHMGDLFFQVGFPFVDRGRGGSVSGLLDALDELLGRIDGKTRIMPGHGEPTDRAGLVEYREMIADVYQAVGELVEEGRSLEEIKAAGVAAKYEERWNWRFISADRFVETIHAELAE